MTAKPPRAVLLDAAPAGQDRYGRNHPLAIPRVSLTVDLIRAFGALKAEEYLVPGAAHREELAAFHDRDYLAALERAQAAGRASALERERHRIGTLENPVFPGFFRKASAAARGSILGARAVLEGRVAFNPAGGMHHAAPGAAHGFCFLNDPVLAILTLRRAGLRVLYLDMDAHHGDGVEAALGGDPGVWTCSLHMDTGYAYPFRGGGIGDAGPLGQGVNLPLPQGVNDAEYRHAFERVWPVVLDRARPDAVVLQAGTDILAPDPLGKFRVSNRAFLAVVARVMADAPRLLALGGGGYHPLALARCWLGVWGVLSGRALPDILPAAGRALLEAVDWDLMDEEEPQRARQLERRLDEAEPGGVRDEVRARVDRLLTTHPGLRRTRWCSATGDGYSCGP
ncbi:acetoin utilization protein AcuC [Ectothiorhodospira mobilis]|uniref:Acetoin utilization protein AcuC n=1 Tax=Ectothiorhodospira mobilis TaxID=195064 RepID=A0A1I4RWW9_ECTMO|nr:acetoin utilization protein AcuC [Ectothiorhodospira mobilis]SFM56776.1 acetoin utilization protein AcuC [Ectothiorhodospira mobilis]